MLDIKKLIHFDRLSQSEPSGQQTLLSLNDLSVNYGDKEILKSISFNFKTDKVYALMGPNGSGKSTLAKTIIGWPGYVSSSGSKIVFAGREITNLEMNRRSQKGIFVSFQSPPEIEGVSVEDLLITALAGRASRLEVKKRIKKYSQELQIGIELIKKPLNQSASGGERKKMELLQAVVINPKLIIFDEIDTGVDVDALRLIAGFIGRHLVKPDKALIFITHYHRILKYLPVDEVLIIRAGRLVKTGTGQLAKEIDKKGYHWLTK